MKVEKGTELVEQRIGKQVSVHRNDLENHRMTFRIIMHGDICPICRRVVTLGAHLSGCEANEHCTQVADEAILKYSRTFRRFLYVIFQILEEDFGRVRLYYMTT